MLTDSGYFYTLGHLGIIGLITVSSPSAHIERKLGIQKSLVPPIAFASFGVLLYPKSLAQNKLGSEALEVSLSSR